EFASARDTILVSRLDRLPRNIQHLITLLNQLNNRHLTFHTLQQSITIHKSTSTPQFLFHLFPPFPHFQPNLILQPSSAPPIPPPPTAR
ncbi:recombinase family protein, partial [Staphylococcus epidermidis]|uniref:recombinase family protein n=1 Tax=Staphylococcus epidermidis TaxID=1282 RepID=UPI001642841F